MGNWEPPLGLENRAHSEESATGGGDCTGAGPQSFAREAVSAATIDQLLGHCQAVLTQLPPSHARAYALSKASEMMFWLRAALRRQQRDQGPDPD